MEKRCAFRDRDYVLSSDGIVWIQSVGDRTLAWAITLLFLRMVAFAILFKPIDLWHFADQLYHFVSFLLLHQPIKVLLDARLTWVFPFFVSSFVLFFGSTLRPDWLVFGFRVRDTVSFCCGGLLLLRETVDRWSIRQGHADIGFI